MAKAKQPNRPIPEFTPEPFPDGFPVESMEDAAPEAVTLVNRPVIEAPATTEQLILAELATLNEYDVLIRTRQRVAGLNAMLADLG